ncbi:DNA repair protein XRCC4 isoform X2 [Paroedura picta]|uniref:DNA repair protein XRCC4 isoform X2 n=1 Tax=Paroedura picta TaxID=143630 RepID=UPI004057A730
MEKKVSKIYPVSEPSKTYFLQITWEKDLGAGFDVILTDGQLSWVRRVSEYEISKEAADMEMEREKYIEELQKVLLFRRGQTDKYNFDISKGEANEDCLNLSYEKNMKDVSFRLGLLDLQKVSSPAETIREMISYCLDSIMGLQTKNEELQKENERLLSDVDDLQEQDVLATSERKIEGEDYEGSTDEESENCMQPSILVPAKPRRDSLLNSPDITDVAPSRKRRQRTQESVCMEPKVASYKDRTSALERPDSAPSKSSDNCTSSKEKPLETEKSSSDPEDLFDDI